MSKTFGLSVSDLDKFGVFDRFLDIDSTLYIDPHLLKHSTVPEMQVAAVTLRQFWTDTISILKHVETEGDVFDRRACSRMLFPELSEAGLGYSRSGTMGSAIGSTLAAGLVLTGVQIVKAGITDPEVFELVGLLEEGIGADRISDMTLYIVLEHVVAFTKRVCDALKIGTQRLYLAGRYFVLPMNPRTGRPLLFLPKDILRTLPVAFEWSDIDYVCHHNEELRARVNHLIGSTWRDAIRDVPKRRLRQILVENPEVLADLINQYKAKPAQPYDFFADPKGELIWNDIALEYTAQYPLNLLAYRRVSGNQILDVVKLICEQFRKLIEDNGLARMLWDNKRKPRPERFVQLLFFAIADSYCRANNLDLSPESNSGRGPVDFKVSSGYRGRVLVELKLSKHRRLVHGFESQLEVYRRSERANDCVYLVVRVTNTDVGIRNVERLQAEQINAGRPCPHLIVVDGRIRRSASRP